MQNESRGAGCGAGAQGEGSDPGAVDTGERLMLIIGTDALGKDEAIGKVLIKGFFETMKAHKQLPHKMFFLNAGVCLTTTNNEIVPILKEIEAMGVEIYSCGTCL